VGQDLQLDLGRLHELYSDLNGVVKEFEGADALSDDIAAATGDDQLSDKVRDFAHNWNDKRAKMTQSVKDLRDQIKAVSDGFTEVDDGLAKALKESADAGPAPAPKAKD
jgi:phage-related minor tail protein